MNTTFDIMQGCPVCLDVKKALLFLNAKAAPRITVDNNDILNDDPRNSFMAAFHKSSDISKWRVPITALERRGVKRMYNSVVEGGGERVFIKACRGWKHHLYLMEGYLR